MSDFGKVFIEKVVQKTIIFEKKITFAACNNCNYTNEEESF